MHYIRLVVLGDSQVGKTSLIRQLVDQEHKFAPELRVQADLERARGELEAGWLRRLRQHERHLERAIETRRLASLLASQLELQRLLLQQQRASGAARKPQPATCAASTAATSKAPRGARKSLPLEAGNGQQQPQSKQPTPNPASASGSSTTEPKPTILISAAAHNHQNLAAAAGSTSGEPAAPPEAGTGRQVGAHANHVGGQLGATTVAAAAASPNEPAVSAVAASVAAAAASDENKGSPPSSSNMIINVTGANGSFQQQQQREPARKQKSCQLAAATDRAHQEQQQQQQPQQPLPPQQQQHRHSYCAPAGVAPSGELATAAATATSEQLSAQAKIINILFTHKPSQMELGGQQQQPTTTAPVVTQQAEVSNSNSGGKKQLMPSLLRQYQRRLSNFHQSGQQAAASASGQQPTGSGSSHQRQRRDPLELELERDRRRERAAEAARAAASLATAAAAAAQAVLSKQEANNRWESSACQVNPSKQPALASLTQAPPAAELYALAADYQRRLRLAGNSSNQEEQKMRPMNLSLNHIGHFSLSYVDRRRLYQLQIVDMPAIEPAHFPASSLAEWSQYRGRSHLLTADAYLLVFDLTRPQTIQYIKMLRDRIFEAREMSQVPVYVIANKADLCPNLQPSLQARRLRKVATRRHQLQQQQQQDQKQQVNQQQAQQPQPPQPPAPAERRLTSGGVGVPAAAARQLLAVYRAHRVRLGGSSPLVSLRRWARLRGAVVPDGPHHPQAAAAASVQSATSQWLQFERNRSMHHSLLAGASVGAASLGGLDDPRRRWRRSLARAYGRLKCYVNRGLKRLGGGGGGSGSGHPTQMELGGGRHRSRQRRHNHRRPSGAAHQRGRQAGRHQRQRRPTTAALGASDAQQQQQQRSWWLATFGVGLGGSQREEPLGAPWAPSRGGSKRKRPTDQSDGSSGCKSDSMRSAGGRRVRHKRRPPSEPAANQPAATSPTSPASVNAALTEALPRRAEPICGARCTAASRQTFYDLFNRLLQTSSTEAARSQLRALSQSQSAAQAASTANTTPPPPPRLQVVSPAASNVSQATNVSSSTANQQQPGKKERRKSSSTGAALWQTISSYALSRSNRSSVSAQSGALAKAAQEEAQQHQQQHHNQQQQQGVHLGAEQYLSVDMLRKLSLVSASSQMSAALEVQEDEEKKADDKDDKDDDDDADEKRSKSALPAPSSSLISMAKRMSLLGRRKEDDQQQEEDCEQENSKRARSAGASTGARRIWYRGVVKKILFHSGKHSIGGLVTAMELQRRADELEQEDLAKNCQDDADPKDEGDQGDGHLAVRAPSIRIIGSGSTASLAANKRASLAEENVNVAAEAANKCDVARAQPEGAESISRLMDSAEAEATRGADMGAEAPTGPAQVEAADLASSSSSAASPTSSLTPSLSSVSLDININNGDNKDDERDEDDDEAEEDKRRQFEQPSPLAAICVAANASGLRKLSADDCLIISRHRRQSMPIDGPQISISTTANDDGDKRGPSGDRKQSACWLLAAGGCGGGGQRADQVRSACEGGETAEFSTRAAEGDSGDPQARRQSIKASIEAAIHLLVPQRAKSNRSASITLGANDAARVPVNIMGAVNVQRSWRDWRQFLGKKRSQNSGTTARELANDPRLRSATSGANSGLADAHPSSKGSRSPRHTRGNKQVAAVAAHVKQDESESQLLLGQAPVPSSPILGFLSTQTAYTRLTSEQQQEAAINFDQLMRINQLTLSAASLVLLPPGDQPTAASTSDHHHPLPQPLQQPPHQEMQAEATENPLAAETGDQQTTMQETEVQPGIRRKPLITRLQSGGNLLLHRTSTKRRQPRHPGIEKPSLSHQDQTNLAEQQQLQQAELNEVELAPLQPAPICVLDRESSNPITKANNKQQEAEQQDEVAQEIATAASQALERQKRRGESLSLVLEPRYDRKQPGAQYPLFVTNDLNPILKDLAQLVRKHWRCNYIECSAHSNWNIKPIIGELTRTLECNSLAGLLTSSSSSSSSSSDESDESEESATSSDWGDDDDSNEGDNNESRVGGDTERDLGETDDDINNEDDDGDDCGEDNYRRRRRRRPNEQTSEQQPSLAARLFESGRRKSRELLDLGGGGGGLGVFAGGSSGASGAGSAKRRKSMAPLAANLPAPNADGGEPVAGCSIM